MLTLKYNRYKNLKIFFKKILKNLHEIVSQFFAQYVKHPLKKTKILSIIQGQAKVSIPFCKSYICQENFNIYFVFLFTTIKNYVRKLQQMFKLSSFNFETLKAIYTQAHQMVRKPLANGSRTKCTYLWIGLRTCTVPSTDSSHTIHYFIGWIDGNSQMRHWQMNSITAANQDTDVGQNTVLIAWSMKSRPSLRGNGCLDALCKHSKLQGWRKKYARQKCRMVQQNRCDAALQDAFR